VTAESATVTGYAPRARAETLPSDFAIGADHATGKRYRLGRPLANRLPRSRLVPVERRERPWKRTRPSPGIGPGCERVPPGAIRGHLHTRNARPRFRASPLRARARPTAPGR